MLKTKYWAGPISAVMLGLALLVMMSTGYAQPPSLPMTVYGYVFVQGTSGQNVTIPNLNVYAKSDSSVIANTTTNSNGYYSLAGINMSTDGAPFDMWVEGVNYTQLAFHAQNVTQLNMNIVDTTPPSIQIISPLPLSSVTSGYATWINATVTDNFVVNSTTIEMTLNGTVLAPTYNSVTGLLSDLTSPLVAGEYNVTIYAEDMAGNNATESWNFTATPEVPPTITITSPTTTSPAYTRSGEPVQVTFNYTEPSPLNWTITISNATGTVVSVSNTTAITPGTITTTVNVTIPEAAPEGTYNLAMTMYNNYNVSATATQTNAVVVVNTPPIVTITSPVNGAYVTTSPVWINGTVTSSDMGTLQPTINDSRFTLSAWVTATGAFSFSNATTIPNGPLSANVSFTDLAGNIGSQTVTFTVDTAPPVIGTPTQVPSASNVQPNQAVTVSASITDTVSGVSSATLSYSNDTVTWTNVAMTLNSTTGLWQATIPGYPAGSSISYYVSAIDGAGNSAVNNNTGTYYVFSVIPEFPTITVLLMFMAFAAALIVLTKRRKTTKT